MNSEVIREIIEAHLPSQYEPLLLTFYGSDVQTNGNLFVFGNDDGTNLCIKPEDGSVYSVDPKNQLPTRFVNTSVKCLAKFLAAHQRYKTVVTKTASEEEQLQVVLRLREQLASIDSKAFDDAENWWAVVLEQMENGLL